MESTKKPSEAEINALLRAIEANEPCSIPHLSILNDLHVRKYGVAPYISGYHSRDGTVDYVSEILRSIQTGTPYREEEVPDGVMI